MSMLNRNLQRLTNRDSKHWYSTLLGKITPKRQSPSNISQPNENQGNQNQQQSEPQGRKLHAINLAKELKPFLIILTGLSIFIVSIYEFTQQYQYQSQKKHMEDLVHNQVMSLIKADHNCKKWLGNNIVIINGVLQKNAGKRLQHTFTVGGTMGSGTITVFLNENSEGNLVLSIVELRTGSRKILVFDATKPKGTRSMFDWGASARSRYQ